MAMLIVAIGVMTILWTAALPAWNQLARREKEAELIFRGEQYARAIRLYQQRFANAYPPSIDVLVDQKFLRREYKDPMTEDGEFELLYVTSQQTRQSGAAGGRGQAQSVPSRGLIGSLGQGGIIGVVSQSTEASLREYNGATQYNEWQFVALASTLQPGIGGRGGRGGEAGPDQPPLGPAIGGGRGNTLLGGRGPDRPPARGQGRGRGGRQNAPRGFQPGRGIGPQTQPLGRGR